MPHPLSPHEMIKIDQTPFPSSLPAFPLVSSSSDPRGSLPSRHSAHHDGLGTDAGGALVAGPRLQPGAPQEVNPGAAVAGLVPGLVAVGPAAVDRVAAEEYELFPLAHDVFLFLLERGSSSSSSSSRNIAGLAMFWKIVILKS